MTSHQVSDASSSRTNLAHLTVINHYGITMSTIDQAIAFAALAHAGQKRKYSGEPYIVHPIEVMMVLRSVTDREDMAIAAILHDVLEDTHVTERQITRRFGQNITRMVVGLTEKPVPGNRAIRMAAERTRLSMETDEVQTIKVADVISNTASIALHDPNFAKVYLQEKRLLLDVLDRAHPDLHARARTQIAA